MGRIRKAAKSLVRRFWFGLTHYQGRDYPIDFTASDVAIIEFAKPYTMTSPERLFALIQAVRYLECRQIQGAIVECGVWRGGSMVAAAKTLLATGGNRELFLFDTYEGMAEPGADDVSVIGQDARKTQDQMRQADGTSKWARASLEDVRVNMQSTGYNPSLVQYVKGRVEETIPAHAPACIAMLRLDTDWYESTRHELVHLYPRLVPGGVLIIDDYGHWLGARKAVNEYFESQALRPLLNRIDKTGRIAVKG
jgi:hypothetical protein